MILTERGAERPRTICSTPQATWRWQELESILRCGAFQLIFVAVDWIWSCAPARLWNWRRCGYSIVLCLRINLKVSLCSSVGYHTKIRWDWRKELDVPLKIHCGVPCYVGWSGFILLNIRTFFLTNTLHIIRRESWKIHVTIPTVSPPFNGVYVTHERQSIYAVWGTSQLLSYTWVADKNSERSSSLQWYMNLSRQLGEMCSVRQVRLRDGTLLLSNPRLLTKHLDSESRTEVLPSPVIIASWKLGNINSAHNQTCLDC